MDWLTLLVQVAPGAAGALAGSLVSWASMRRRVVRLERRLTAVLRVLLVAGLAPEQRALVEAVLADGAGEARDG